MKRVIVTALPIGISVGVAAGILHLSDNATQALMLCGLLLAMAIILPVRPSNFIARRRRTR
jgi:hypothetical protein